MSLSHPRGPAKGLVARLERPALATPGQVDEGLGRLAWDNSMGITGNLLSTEVLEDMAYIMVRSSCKRCLLSSILNLTLN